MQWNKYCRNFRISEMPKSLNLTLCGYNGFPLGHYYLNHAIPCFWPSFFRVSVQYRSLVQAKEAQMGGYSCSSSNRLQKPAGTLPQLCLSILWAGATPPCSGLCWVCHRTWAKMWRSEWVLLMEWKMDYKLHTHTHTEITFFLKWLTILIKKNIVIVVSFKPSEIVYSNSLQQGEWVKLLNRIHSDWLNWSQAKTDLQDLRDSSHRAGRANSVYQESTDHTTVGKW